MWKKRIENAKKGKTFDEGGLDILQIRNLLSKLEIEIPLCKTKDDCIRILCNALGLQNNDNENNNQYANKKNILKTLYDDDNVSPCQSEKYYDFYNINEREKYNRVNETFTLKSGTILYHGNVQDYREYVEHGMFFGLSPVISLWILTEQWKKKKKGTPKLYVFRLKRDVSVIKVASIDMEYIRGKLNIPGKINRCKNQVCMGSVYVTAYDKNGNQASRKQGLYYEIYIPISELADNIEEIENYNIDIHKLFQNAYDQHFCPMDAILNHSKIYNIYMSNKVRNKRKRNTNF